MAKKKRVVRRPKQAQSIISDEITIPNHSGMLDAGKVHRTPTDNLDPVNKKYVDDQLTPAGTHPHQDVRTTAKPSFTDIDISRDNGDITWTGVNNTQINCFKAGDGTDVRMDCDLIPEDGASDARFSIFRFTNTTGERAFTVFKGNSTTTKSFEVDGETGNVTSQGTVQGVTQAEFDTLTDNSIADALHRHSELVASDGTPDPALSIDADGNGEITGALTVNGNLLASEYIAHDGDTDTHIRFVNNAIQFRAGGVENMAFAVTSLVFNEAGNDVNIKFESSADPDSFRLDGGTGFIGMGTGSPDTKLQVVGDFKTGQDTTNYATFLGDGELNLYGTARVKKHLWVGAEGLKAPGLKPASFVSLGIKGAWEFADAAAGNEETVSGTIKIPPEMDITVVPTFNIGWSADGSSPGDCEWQFEYLWITGNEDTTAAAQETLTVTSTASATSNGLIVACVTGIDLPSETDKAMFWRIKRLSNSGNDTISAVVHMHGNFLEYTANKLGEAT